MRAWLRSRRELAQDFAEVLQRTETDRDIARGERDRARADVAARAAERDAAYEALGKVAAAAGRPGAPTRWNVEDLVQWVAAAGKVEDQRDTLGAELIAVDEALAAAGVDWTDDRATGIRDLADRRAQDAHEHFGQAADALVDVLGLTSCVRDGCGHARHQHAGECRGVLAGTRGAPCRCEAFDDGVVDAEIADAPAGDGSPCSCAWCELVRQHGRPPRPGAWCSAELDGARCARPAGHTEPCRPTEPAPVGPQVAQCLAIGFWGERCALVTGHPHAHSWGCTS